MNQPKNNYDLRYLDGASVNISRTLTLLPEIGAGMECDKKTEIIKEHLLVIKIPCQTDRLTGSKLCLESQYTMNRVQIC